MTRRAKARTGATLTARQRQEPHYPAAATVAGVDAKWRLPTDLRRRESLRSGPSSLLA
jgi:hypothetical protein